MRAIRQENSIPCKPTEPLFQKREQGNSPRQARSLTARCSVERRDLHYPVSPDGQNDDMLDKPDREKSEESSSSAEAAGGACVIPRKSLPPPPDGEVALSLPLTSFVTLGGGPSAVAESSSTTPPTAISILGAVADSRQIAAAVVAAFARAGARTADFLATPRTAVDASLTLHLLKHAAQFVAAAAAQAAAAAAHPPQRLALQRLPRRTGRLLHRHAVDAASASLHDNHKSLGAHADAAPPPGDSSVLSPPANAALAEEPPAAPAAAPVPHIRGAAAHLLLS
ncbi:uncharacterized protein LOC113146532 [Cyclospora cayetanensis]|uniref:Uncharacterized protein LOC113146532 n=1 Tax=Cyclospora cayetanensis TaxID=88456 RepID=A0A6P6RQU0_9EIME|nr:uncharacterized protein LOC113146532 [Cyclospora cayetanensis]